MIGLTRTQRDLLLAIDELTCEAGGVSPSYRELADALGLASINPITRGVRLLRDSGMIRTIPNCARAIEITPAGRGYIDALCADIEITLAADVEWVAA
jgi:SOS-response transcriptional repressor LexA